MESWIGFRAQMIAYTRSLKPFFRVHYASIETFSEFQVHFSFVKSCCFYK